VWGRVLVEADYEVGFLAGPGLRLGLRGADLPGRRARNEGADDRRGRGVLGILIGKYVAYVHLFRDFVRSEFGDEVAGARLLFRHADGSLLSRRLHLALSGFDIVWAVLAVADGLADPASRPGLLAQDRSRPGVQRPFAVRPKTCLDCLGDADLRVRVHVVREPFRRALAAGRRRSRLPGVRLREDAPPAFRVRGSRHRRATELRRIFRRRMLRRGLWLRILTH
jgi:hypothetical protein